MENDKAYTVPIAAAIANDDMSAHYTSMNDRQLQQQVVTQLRIPLLFVSILLNITYFSCHRLQLSSRFLIIHHNSILGSRIQQLRNINKGYMHPHQEIGEMEFLIASTIFGLAVDVYLCGTELGSLHRVRLFIC